jgi:hypothetical protein
MVDGPFRMLRRRQSGADADLDRRRGESVVPGPALLVQVFAETTVPTATGKYFACHPVVPSGTEGEGGTPSFAVDTAQTLYVAIFGIRVPVAGDRLIARLVGGRWVGESGKTSVCGTICTTVIACGQALGGATVTVSQGGGTIGSCTTDMSVSSLTLGTAGSGYTTVPDVTIAGGGGTGATAVARVKLSGASISAAGTGYVVNNVLTVVGGSFTTVATVRVTAVGAGGAVTGISVAAFGNYGATPANPVAVTGGGGTGAMFDLTWTVLSLAVTAGGAGYTSTPAVTFSGSGGTTATAQMVAKCCVPISSAGTYTVDATKAGYTTVSGSVSATCTTNNTSRTIAPTGGTLVVRVNGCTDLGPLRIAGATVTVTQGATVQSQTSNATGDLSFPVVNANATVVVTATRFDTITETFLPVTGCTVQNKTYNLLASSGFNCVFGCSYPTTITLQVQDSAYGNTTMTCCGLGHSVSNGWLGQQVVGFPGCGACSPSGNVLIHYEFDRATGNLFVYWNESGSPPCPCDYTFGALCPSGTGVTATRVAYNCPNPTGFLGSWTVPAGGPYCSGATITLLE